MKAIWLGYLLCSASLFGEIDREEYRFMDEIALKVGADKASDFHDYTSVYSQYFGRLKNKPVRLLEIGICKGRSVELWEEYFPHGELYFIDITYDFLEVFPVRSTFYLADQEKPEDLARVVRDSGGEFDIIIDDGGHTMNQQIVSFRELFPHLKSGGIYIVEDLHTSYWPMYGGGDGPNTTLAYLKRLIDDVNAVGARTKKASHLNLDPSLELTPYQKEILSIHFYDSVAVILKR